MTKINKLGNIKKIIKNILPDPLFQFLIRTKNIPKRIKEDKMIRDQPKLHKEALTKVREKARNGGIIKVAFFVEHSSIWKYEGVYKLFEEDNRFEPIVVIVPVVTYGYENMIYEMDKAYETFKTQGYSVIKTYNKKTNKYFDIRKEINPDIIFYTRPYEAAIDKRYFITEFRDKLTCYVNYGYHVSHILDVMYNSTLSQLVWRFFLETDLHLEMLRIVGRNKGINGVVTGYPGVDKIRFGEKIENQAWKNSSEGVKRIIWAPHHTIGEKEWLMLSNFLNYYDSILDIAEKYKESIQIAFKPHPLLKVKLYNHIDWGKEKTDKYYDRWNQGENTQLDTDLYIDTFNSSDAMIHDSSSFTAEYLHSGKPILYTMKEGTKGQYNEFGILALEQHYHGYGINDIERFIEEVILNDNDYMKDSRVEFYAKVLKPDQTNSASFNIYQYICKEVFNNI